MTYTYAILEVSRECWEEIQNRLKEAGHFSGPFSLVNDREVIDLHGLALRIEKQNLMMITPPPGTEHIRHLEETPFPKDLFRRVREKYEGELELVCPSIGCEGELEIFTIFQGVKVYLACRLCGWSGPSQSSKAEVFRESGGERRK